MKKDRKMLIKVLVALAGITLTVSILFFTPLWGTAILVCALSVLSCYELLVPTGVCQKPVPVIVCLLTAAAVPWLRYFGVAETGTLLLSLCLLTFAFLYSAAAGQYHNSKAIAYLFLASIVFPSFFSLCCRYWAVKTASGLCCSHSLRREALIPAHSSEESSSAGISWRPGSVRTKPWRASFAASPAACWVRRSMAW